MQLLLALLACSSPAPEPETEPRPMIEAEPAFPATARVETWREMKADLEAERSPADGGGTVRIVQAPEEVEAGTPGRWSLVYEVGEHGIVDGGRIVFQAPPFWGWSAPQTHAAYAAGYTTVETDADARLAPIAMGQGMLSIGVHGALKPGDEVRITYGAGDIGAVADRFAERGTPLWIAVDGDGDGVRALVADPPVVDVVAGPTARLIVTLPTVAAPGEAVDLRVAALDATGNAWRPEALELSFEAGDELDVPETRKLTAADRGVVRVPITPTKAGIYSVRVLGSGGLVGVSNPMVVREGAARVLWGDLQIHSGLSDGSGTPADAYRYAREVAGLDVAVVTDHDHWGMRFLDQNPEMWAEIVDAAEGAYVPGEFVTAVGFEWTSWLYGHRHVVYFDEGRELLSSMDARYDTPEELWSALRGRDVLTIAHHSAGGPVATDWRVPPDPELEPITEICSVHGQSESPETPGVIYDAVPGNFVFDQLVKGYRLGFLGSTDGHDGHPGLSHLAGPSGGLAAIVTDDVTREGVLEALRARRVYATNGVRMLLRVTVAGQPMGSVVPASAADVPVEVRVVGTSPVVRLELVRREGVVGTARPDAVVAHHTWTLSDLQPGDFVYVRALQADGGVAWSSPVFVD